MLETATLERWLSEQLPHWEAPRVESLVEVDGGWESDVYDIRVRHGAAERGPAERLALRRYAGDGDVALREFGGMRHLFLAGYPVPEVLGVESSDEVLGRPFMVMRWVDGEIKSWHAADLDGLARLMADLHRLDWRPLHDDPGSDPAGAAELIERWRQQVAAFPLESIERCLDWLARAATAVRSLPAIVHLDFHTGNVLIGADGSATVIDWTQVGVADRRLDVAWTEMLLSMAVGEVAAARFRIAYEHQVGSLEQMEWFEMASAAKRLYSVLVSMRAGPEAMGMRPEARERMVADIQTLEVPWRRVEAISGIDVVEAHRLFEA